MPRTPAPGLLCLAVAWVQPCPVRGQIYHFENTAVPENHSLQTLYAFYIYSIDEAPDRSLGMPFVKFSNLGLHATSQPASGLQQYKGIQLSFIRYRDFWQVVSPTRLCSTWRDVATGRAKQADQLLLQQPPGANVSYGDMYRHTLRYVQTPQQDVKSLVHSTGVYMLLFSNCGYLTAATASGTVVVRNAYGFLPGNEYPKMPFYSYLLLVYVGLAVIWAALSIRFWKELFNIQNCIATVILFGLLESFLWYLFYTDWNSTGNRGKLLFISAILLTVVKSIFSYMLVLVAALGWGVTKPFLDSGVVCRIQALSFVYIVLDFIRETALSFRHSHSLSLAFVLLCLLPVSLLNGAIFYWVFTALSDTMASLKEKYQTEKLLLFKRLWRVLVLSLALATCMLLFQMVNLSRSITARWKSQWIQTDLVSHSVFLLVLVCMMFLWAPHQNSQRYAYSTQLGPGEGNQGPPPAAVWAEEDGRLDDESTRRPQAPAAGDQDAGGRGGAPADVVGAVERDEL